jgi:tellurite resistance protein TerC
MTSWIIFFIIIAFAFIVDTFAHSKKQTTPIKEALVWSLFWILLALAYNGWIYYSKGKDPALNFFTAYLVEKTLSIDNLFVFLVIFKAFAIPPSARHKILFWGILGAFVMRAIFIIGGIFLLTKFHWVFYVFGAFLIYSGIKLMKSEKEETKPEHNPLALQLQKWFPIVHDPQAKTFFVIKEGVYYATPLFLALVAIETTDIIFALDSIPAVLGITTDPLIVFTSNMFAILGLRSLYFVLESSFDYFHYLHYGLSLVLIFIGLKMISADFFPIPTEFSLGVIAAVLGVAMLASKVFPQKNQK